MPWTLDNPVVTKELRGRMRGARTYWLLFGYLLLLSLILFFSYLGWWNSHSNAMEIGRRVGGLHGRADVLQDPVLLAGGDDRPDHARP